VVIVTLDRTQSSLPPTFTHTPSPEPTATFTPSATPIPLSSYPIVFAAVPPQTFLPSLFTGQADGAGIADVGDEDGYFDIALSPDGASIAFVRDIAPADSGERDWQLFTAPVTNPTDVNRITNIESAGIEHPAWSSDGRSIVYAANVDGDYDLFRVPSNPDGSAEPVALTDNVAYDSYPAFAPDGDTLLFVSDINTPGFTRMFRLTAEGVLSPFSNVTGAITSPVYSPDGTRVAYIQRQSGDPDLFVIGADGQRPFQLTIDDTADDRSPAWSRDGRWIAFASNRNGNRFLWYFVNTDTSVVVPLNDLAEAQSIAFLPEQGG
jgi:Tol biopolymer transport system component